MSNKSGDLVNFIEKKVFKDSVLGYINVEDQVIWELIDTPFFQRLRRIRHLGCTTMVFHTAEHSRFTHSLGVYEITRRMIEKIANLNLNNQERLAVLASALLHDIGHGPLSHLFEEVTEYHHEKMGQNIIKYDKHIARVLQKYAIQEDVLQILQKKHPRKILSQLVTSQIDADRLDYLLRDSFNTGVVYGNIDIERLFRVATVVEDQVCFKKSAVREIELFFLSRAFMYEKIYTHQATISSDILLLEVLKRYRKLVGDNYAFQGDYELLNNYFHEVSNILNFFLLDDYTLIHYVKLMMIEEDPLLKKFASAFINRRLLKYVDFVNEGEIASLYKMCCDACEKKGLDPSYNLFIKKNKIKVYDRHEPIYILDNKELQELEMYDIFLGNRGDLEYVTLFYTQEMEKEIENIVNWRN